MNPQDVEKLITALLDQMNVSYTLVAAHDTGGDKSRFEITTNEPERLLGSDGEVLKAFSHVLSRAVAKEDKTFRFVLDVNGHRKEEEKRILDKAKMFGDRVLSFKMDVHMDSASPYERLLVHEFFANHDVIATESEGVGPTRHVVLKYKQQRGDEM